MSESYRETLEHTTLLNPDEVNMLLKVRGDYDAYTDEEVQKFIGDNIKPDKQQFCLEKLAEEDQKHNIIFFVIYHNLTDAEKKIFRSIYYKASNTPIIHKIGSKLHFYYNAMRKDKISPEDALALSQEQEERRNLDS